MQWAKKKPCHYQKVEDTKLLGRYAWLVLIRLKGLNTMSKERKFPVLCLYINYLMEYTYQVAMYCDCDCAKKSQLLCNCAKDSQVIYDKR